MAKIVITLEDVGDELVVTSEGLSKANYNPELASHYVAVVALDAIKQVFTQIGAKAAAELPSSTTLEGLQ